MYSPVAHMCGTLQHTTLFLGDTRVMLVVISLTLCKMSVQPHCGRGVVINVRFFILV